MPADLTRDAFLGTTTALLSAVLWAFSSPLLEKPVLRYGARAINLYKSLLAAVLFAATMIGFLGVDAPMKAAASLPWFALSGVVGLAIGDTAYFVSLARLGPSVALILYQLSTVFGFALGVAFRGERPTSPTYLGAALVVVGVAYATTGRRRDVRAAAGAGDGGESEGEARTLARGRSIGVVAGLVSAACQAIGLLINQRAWDEAAAAGYPRTEPVNATLAATARMGATALALLVVVTLAGRARKDTAPLREREGWRLTFVPAMLGTYFGILTMQLAIGNLDLGVASTLLATSPIFVIPAAWLLGRERPTLRKTVGALVATAGVALISL
jgi:drug/metabolite transporter (DMT)-like permease